MPVALPTRTGIDIGIGIGIGIGIAEFGSGSFITCGSADIFNVMLWTDKICLHLPSCMHDEKMAAAI